MAFPGDPLDGLVATGGRQQFVLYLPADDAVIAFPHHTVDGFNHDIASGRRRG